jgi:hypothetical protein
MDHNSKLIGAGVTGAVLLMLCCFTPVLVILLSALGLTAFHCQARLRAGAGIRSVYRSGDLRACSQATQLRRQAVGAKLGRVLINWPYPLSHQKQRKSAHSNIDPMCISGQRIG